MEKKQLRDELTAQESTLREEFQMTDAKYRESERALKELSEKFRTTKNDLEKQRSLLEQEMSFIKQENDSLRSKVTQLKEAHDMALASYQASMSQESQESMSRRIIEIQNEHTMEIDRQTNGFNAERNRMNCEFTNLTTKHFELETRYNAYRTQKDLE
jgi:chromosome segregation ATPase